MHRIRIINAIGPVCSGSGVLYEMLSAHLQKALPQLRNSPLKTICKLSIRDEIREVKYQIASRRSLPVSDCKHVSADQRRLYDRLDEGYNLPDELALPLIEEKILGSPKGKTYWWLDRMIRNTFQFQEVLGHIRTIFGRDSLMVVVLFDIPEDVRFEMFKKRPTPEAALIPRTELRRRFDAKNAAFEKVKGDLIKMGDRAGYPRIEVNRFPDKSAETEELMMQILGAFPKPVAISEKVADATGP